MRFAPSSDDERFFESEVAPEPEAPLYLTATFPAGPFRSVRDVVTAALDLGARTAVHEILEWTRFRGSKPIDAHSEDGIGLIISLPEVLISHDEVPA